MRYKAVIFDLDGTIVNTLIDLANAMNYGLDRLKQPTHTVQKCMLMIGDGVSTFAKRALKENCQELHQELLEIMKQRYRETFLKKAFVYDGIGEVVETLRKARIDLAVLTNKDQDIAELMVEHFFGKGTFWHIAGVTNNKPIKPDPGETLKIVKSSGFLSKDFLLVGDSPVDIETAKAANICSVGAGWGFRGSEQLKAAKADHVIDKPLEILDLMA
ncbi:MAG: HAD family hydrolase [Sedimentisphaerales bacterium]|nr:HAD family hydrolase [Sedimentisphaerales bacterium]